ncbi:neuronal acetylcholine receptor subunit alpha-4-like [Schistocerca serialis cubense]|uniref:neuronal acetylcholine receptor subunit alpha-4-like n=1 Tax=Schistocerca serialis cubense TaxID=2023355 RepID=UPI00214E6E7D|nr:neuronal acetylcholine receptor subunit alpha-4-like [Schistocerca serialis cubense]
MEQANVSVYYQDQVQGSNRLDGAVVDVSVYCQDLGQGDSKLQEVAGCRWLDEEQIRQNWKRVRRNIELALAQRYNEGRRPFRVQPGESVFFATRPPLHVSAGEWEAGVGGGSGNKASRADAPRRVIVGSGAAREATWRGAAFLHPAPCALITAAARGGGGGGAYFGSRAAEGVRRSAAAGRASLSHCTPALQQETLPPAALSCLQAPAEASFAVALAPADRLRHFYWNILATSSGVVGHELGGGPARRHSPRGAFFTSLPARAAVCRPQSTTSFVLAAAASAAAAAAATAAALLVVCASLQGAAGNPDAKRLYDDLLSNYNKLVRPVVNVSDALTVKIKLKLSQLIDVNLKNQIMTTNLWVEQSWYDYKLQWDPREYGGVEMLHVPSDHIWRPDIVLYNNADGNFEVTLATKATLNYTGRVEWKPPAIYKSSCEIDVEYFPFDEQTCVMKFGSWTYDGFQVDLRHIDEVKDSNVVELGVDLSEFYTSVEWDILEVPAVRNEKYYTCCDEPYLDITFNITMRRKTLFYTVNLIIPCMGISFLTVLVFYLPSDSGEKVSLSISILLSLTVFFLLLAEIIPPTSLVVPLLGKFVLFTMILDTFSICVTVVVLNVHFRSPQTHVMAPWVRRVFIHILPRLLVMRRPQYQIDKRSFGLATSAHRVMVRTCNGLELRDSSLLSAAAAAADSSASSELVAEPSPHDFFPRLLDHEFTSSVRQEKEYAGSSDSTGYKPTVGNTADEQATQNFSVRRLRGPLGPAPAPLPCNINEPGGPERPQKKWSRRRERHKGGALRPSSGQVLQCSGAPAPALLTCRSSSSLALCPLNILPGTKSPATECYASRTVHNGFPGAARPASLHWHRCPELHKAIDGVRFIADHTKREEDSTRVKEDWKYVAMVLDRLFLWIFTLAVLVGTAGIILQAPTLYDDRVPIDVRLSEIATTTAKPHVGSAL